MNEENLIISISPEEKERKMFKEIIRRVRDGQRLCNSLIAGSLFDTSGKSYEELMKEKMLELKNYFYEIDEIVSDRHQN